MKRATLTGDRKAAAAEHAWRVYRDTQQAGAPSLGGRLRALPRMLGAARRGEYKGLSGTKLGLLAFAVVYIISPIDGIPEFLPFIGVADDLGVLLWLLTTLISAAGDFVQWERGRPGMVDGEVITDVP